jgi:hypothetical protein
MVTEEVPSANRTPAVVLTIIELGVDRYPIESRIVTVCPGFCTLVRSTIALGWAVVNKDVSMRTADVLAFTMISAILLVPALFNIGFCHVNYDATTKKCNHLVVVVTS